MKNRAIGIHHIMSIGTHIGTSQSPLEYFIVVVHLKILLIIGSNTRQRSGRLAIGGDLRNTGWSIVDTCCDAELILIVEREPIHKQITVKHFPLTRHRHLILHLVTRLKVHHLLNLLKVTIIIAHIDLRMQMFLQ